MEQKMNFLHSKIGSAKDNFYSPVHKWKSLKNRHSIELSENVLVLQ
jgi:hypothetical protein